jgi:uridylate kinase
MDDKAIVLCHDNGIALRIFNMNKAGDLQRGVRSENVGTMVTND